jgi:hypothetical protein
MLSADEGHRFDNDDAQQQYDAHAPTAISKYQWHSHSVIRRMM